MLILAPLIAFCLTWSALFLSTTGHYDQAHGIYQWGPVPFLGTMVLFLTAYFLGYIAGRARD